MAEVTKVASKISPGTLSPPPCNQLTRKVGEAIAAGDMVYLNTSNQWMRTNGTADTAPAQWVGMAMEARAAGSPLALTVMWNLEVPYASTGLTVGAPLYISAAVPGGLSTTATTGGPAGWPAAWVSDYNATAGEYTIYVRGRSK
jgi:hypothetical protein